MFLEVEKYLNYSIYNKLIKKYVFKITLIKKTKITLVDLGRN